MARFFPGSECVRRFESQGLIGRLILVRAGIGRRHRQCRPWKKRFSLPVCRRCIGPGDKPIFRANSAPLRRGVFRVQPGGHVDPRPLILWRACLCFHWRQLKVISDGRIGNRGIARLNPDSFEPIIALSIGAPIDWSGGLSICFGRLALACRDRILQRINSQKIHSQSGAIRAGQRRARSGRLAAPGRREKLGEGR